MAKEVATMWKVMVNNVDLSDWAYEVSGTDEREKIDVSGFTGFKEYVPGVRDQAVSVSFVNDRASGGPHQTLESLYTSGTTFPFFVQPHSDVGTSATNPIFGGTASIYSFPFGASLNEREELTVEFAPASNSTFTWGTAWPL